MVQTWCNIVQSKLALCHNDSYYLHTHTTQVHVPISNLLAHTLKIQHLDSCHQKVGLLILLFIIQDRRRPRDPPFEFARSRQSREFCESIMGWRAACLDCAHFKL